MGYIGINDDNADKYYDKDDGDDDNDADGYGVCNGYAQCFV